MNQSISILTRWVVPTLFSVVLVSACSSSNNSASLSANVVEDVDVVNGNGNVTDELIVEENLNNIDAPEPVQASLEIVPDKTFRMTWSSSTNADYYRVLENPDGVSGFNVVSEDLATSVFRYDHRVALYKRTNAQYIIQACNSSGCVDSENLIISGTLEQAVGFFKATNAQGGVVDTSFGFPPITFGADFFGVSLKLSADGNTLVVAATSEDSGATGVNGMQDDNSVEDSGAVYVFARADNLWQLEAYLKASNTDEGDRFGSDLSLSDDGNTLVVGVPNESSAAVGINGEQADDSADSSGAVYVFSRSNRVWEQQSYIKASNAEERDKFGASVDLSGDGNTLVVGSRFESGSGRFVNSDSDEEGAGNGAAYVYTRSGETWAEQAYLKASNSDELDNFGHTVSISGDGRTIAVQAFGERSVATGINGNEDDNSSFNSGAVYLFTFNDAIWQQEAYIKSSNNEKVHLFGDRSIDLNDDGSTLVVGVRDDDNLTIGLSSAQSDGTIQDSGSVYVFTRSNGNWQGQAFLKASNTQSRGLFGTSVSLSGDGNTLAVGAASESGGSLGVNGDENNTIGLFVGAAYVFERSGDSWHQQAYVKASNTELYDDFGIYISLSRDGNSLAVSAFSEGSSATTINGDQSDNSAPGSGAVYLY